MLTAVPFDIVQYFLICSLTRLTRAHLPNHRIHVVAGRLVVRAQHGQGAQELNLRGPQHDKGLASAASHASPGGGFANLYERRWVLVVVVAFGQAVLRDLWGTSQWLWHVGANHFGRQAQQNAPASDLLQD